MPPTKYQKQLAKLTGTMGPGSSANWPYLDKTQGSIYSMKSTPLIYNTQSGLYNTAYDANADVLSVSFPKLKFGKFWTKSKHSKKKLLKKRRSKGSNKKGRTKKLKSRKKL